MTDVRNPPRARHRWMVIMPFEIPASDARKMSTPGALPTIDQVPATELARGEVPLAEDPRPWFGLHNVVHELVSVGCYVCEEPYSDEAEAAGCPGDPTGRTTESLRLPAPRIGLSTVGRNDPCPCGSGKKYKRCHGSRP
jgi:hypothetical protein